jgi:hypothetical protein
MMDLKTTACVLGAAFAVSAAQANRPLNTDTADTVWRAQPKPGLALGAIDRRTAELRRRIDDADWLGVHACRFR